METQPGARTPLVDPFGRELEEWLRDVPATRTPYLADLVVPPVTGPVQRPVTSPDALVGPSDPQSDTAEPTPAVQPAAGPVDTEQPAAETGSFRRRDRARHVAACAPSFPEPPARMALRIEDLAVEVSAASGRTTVERIVLLEDEVRRRDEDLARLAAWEATVAGLDDAEVAAARSFARAVFADLLADAADEAGRRERAAARRASTSPLPTPVRDAARPDRTAAVRTRHVRAATTASVLPVAPGAESTTGGRDEPVRPVLSLPDRTPVSANTRPTPLVQPATGPTVIDRAAFAAALTAHAGTTASTPVVLPDAVAIPAGHQGEATPDATSPAAAATEAGWWARLVTRLRGLFGRR
ncbi:hypothetical protein [Curtobacterium caseinilyticum]|uniref:DUF222 domain-containing protein n=1 Tax=Curtobacterium caseinilyticum TaxID=3055137 RepID=A0ABT7TPY6_9MICO|nr:hypothetical protein [Curtobacterium caseinilyticum]MDM7891666.1 hypothetical protein [Curtobacterium caseinilyticum]